MADVTTWNPILQAFLAGLFTWALTALGATFVFAHRSPPRIMLDVALGFSGGIMLAASFWSLLAPSIELAEAMGIVRWWPAAVGFLSGAAVIALFDRVLPHLHLNFPEDTAEGLPSPWRRTTLLVSAITLHNIPEGLAVGVAFGAVAAGVPGATLEAAFVLALGIGLQNVPEGLAIAMPLRREGVSRFKAFTLGQASALVEPVAAVVGAAAVLFIRPILPYALAFAAGAMVFVVVEELIPESQRGGNADAATLGLLGGFVVMMVLDVAIT